MFTYDLIFVELNIGKGIPKAIELQINKNIHVKQLAYKQILYKCNGFMSMVILLKTSQRRSPLPKKE
jgi:hypothetical protein